jgi:hypothetical protein
MSRRCRRPRDAIGAHRAVWRDPRSVLLARTERLRLGRVLGGAPSLPATSLLSRSVFTGWDAGGRVRFQSFASEAARVAVVAQATISLTTGWILGSGWGGFAEAPQEAVHQRAPHPLYLDGGAWWQAYTGPDDARQLGRLPVDSENVVSAVPEPTDRNHSTAVTLLYQGSRVGYLYRSLANSLFGAINGWLGGPGSAVPTLGRS